VAWAGGTDKGCSTVSQNLACVAVLSIVGKSNQTEKKEAASKQVAQRQAVSKLETLRSLLRIFS
jgi:ABC-type phosphonate transport system ATPase subunit